MEERNNSRQQSHRAAWKRRVEKQMQEDADGKGRRAVTELQALFLDFFGLDSMKTLVIWPGYSNPKGKLHKPLDLLCVCFLHATNCSLFVALCVLEYEMKAIQEKPKAMEDHLCRYESRAFVKFLGRVLREGS